MWKLIKVVFAGIAFSMFYFPFEFTFLPGYNTKKILAAIGCLIVLYKCATAREIKLSRNIIEVIAFSAIVSVIGIISNVYNSTTDYVYATYTMSMLVWLGAAFTISTIIKLVHGDVSMELIAAYIVSVCVAQCVLAQLINSIPSVKFIVDAYIQQGQVFLSAVNRLYGIGASLDVAGSRFAVGLIVIVSILSSGKSLDIKTNLLYIASFLIIAVLGSMVARTTYVGVIVASVYLMSKGRIFSSNVKVHTIKIGAFVGLALAIAIPILMNLYSLGGDFNKMLRFAFEGFFNLAETGEWSIASNDKLKTMYVFPDSLKTWIIGDGYFNNPINVDPFYVGKITEGYYKGTDVGYLRFIFYFGLTGLLAFIVFFVKVAQYCIQKNRDFKWTFILILVANFMIWLKVSTDLFLVFALFLCVGNMQDKSPQVEV